MRITFHVMALQLEDLYKGAKVTAWDNSGGESKGYVAVQFEHDEVTFERERKGLITSAATGTTFHIRWLRAPGAIDR